MKTFILKHDNIIAIPCNMRVKCTLVYTELFCFRRGDVTITMHAIPHSGTRNEGEEPRMNMIWRIRSKMRQPGFVCDGATDHPDRWSRVSQGHKHPRLQLSCQFVQMAGEVHRDTERGDETLLVITQADPNAENVNGEDNDMQFAQNEPLCLPLGTFTSQNPPTRHCLRFVSYVCVPGHRYYPGERGNDPYERSKYALSHIWHEWPGMADIVAEMKEKESESGVYPKGAGRMQLMRTRSGRLRTFGVKVSLRISRPRRGRRGSSGRGMGRSTRGRCCRQSRRLRRSCDGC